RAGAARARRAVLLGDRPAAAGRPAPALDRTSPTLSRDRGRRGGAAAGAVAGGSALLPSAGRSGVGDSFPRPVAGGDRSPPVFARARRGVREVDPARVSRGPLVERRRAVLRLR